jgi:protocatechuate 3,4-dioxygenase alpha subunit
MTAATEVTLIPTSSQTVGPFVEIGCKYLESDRVVAKAPDTVDAVVRGRVLDGDGNIVPDFMLEIWQTTPNADPAFARVMPSSEGSFVFHTVYRAPNSDMQTTESAPHLAMLVFMRGLLKPVLTRMYFPDDPRNADDPVLALVPTDRRGTLIAAAVSSEAPFLRLEWNVVLQGADETVFFEW